MLESIRRLLRGDPAPEPGEAAPGPDDDGLRAAVCALLLEVAHADGEFAADERRHVEEALARHFDIAPAAARELMTIAQERRRQAVDLHQFTSRLTARFDEGQRMTMAEVLWRVVYADGRLSEHEDYLMRKLSNLLDLRPGYLNAARARARGETA